MTMADIKHAAKDIELSGIPELFGEPAKAFDEYDKRALTKKEKVLLKDADDFYQIQYAKNK